MPTDLPLHRSDGTPDDRALDAFAADWLARRDAGWTAHEAAEFGRWRARDPRHDEAVRRVEKTQGLLARLGESPGVAEMYREVDALCTAHRRRIWRRRWLPAAVGLAAAAAVAVAFLLPDRPEPSVVFAATTVPRSAIDLPDGSTLDLSAHTEVRVEFQRHERRLDLAFGEAHFAVAKDSTRPFVVAVGSVSVRAVGTAFTIRRSEHEVDVRVIEGEVEVTRLGNPADTASALPPFNLVAGHRARIATTTSDAEASHVVPYIVTRDGDGDPAHLVFASTPLAEAVELFNRHNRVQMEIGDAELLDRTLGGNFQADNAEAFIALLNASGDILVERVSDTRVILRSAPKSTP